MKQNLWKHIKPIVRPVYAVAIASLMYLLRVFPIKTNKVAVCIYSGKRYGDNQQFIMEHLHKRCPYADIVWVKNPRFNYEVPSWMRTVKWRSWRYLYEYATARIWIDNCTLPDYFVKRKGQLYVETWHGGLGIKKIGDDTIGELGIYKVWRLKNTSDMADVYISNSDHLSKIYRRAFRYHGPIWKCGYPKNDILVKNSPEDGNIAKTSLGIPQNNKVLLYAPTWRLRFQEGHYVDMSVYNLDLHRLKHALESKYGGQWTVVIRFHSEVRLYAKDYQEQHPDIIDATPYQDMQRLLIATDVMVSDYSSCIFDAALRRIPCFTYATDFEQYKNEERGVYYEMDELPFPYARNNDEMEHNVRVFDLDEYLKRWDAFTVRMGLNETGHSAHDIAAKMADFLNGRQVEWPNDWE